MKKLKVMSLALATLVSATLFAGCTSNSAEGNDTQNGNQTTVVENKSADIVVIGAGGAGMAAAMQAVQNGATNVVILEKMPQTGGNTIRTTGGMNAAATELQATEGIEDSVELMIEDTMKGGKNLNDPELVKVLAEKSADGVKWVTENGGDLSEVGMFGGASVKRIHKPTGGSAVGPMLVKMFNENMDKLNIPVLLETKADQIIVEDGKIAGVKASNKDGEFTIDCKAVVLATGGFAGNAEMVVEYNPALTGFGTTNHAGATGDGIAMAKELGAQLVDIEQIQTHPTVHPETQTMYTEAVRGNGAILVNKEGKRFVNELLTRDVVSEAILAQTDKESYIVFDQKVRDGLSAIEKYISAGIIYEADTIEGLAEQIGVDATALKATMDTYAGYQAAGNDAEFGRESMEEPLTTAKYYAGLCAPAVHHTMGGVKINTNTEVLKEDGSSIPGLFAAGEVTGGVHGANRLGGNAVTDIVVFGRIAGENAAKYVVDNGGNTEATIKVEKETETAKPEVDGGYKDGVYTGTGKGNGGDVTVEVTVEGGNIVKIELKDHKETPGIFEGAEAGVSNEIIKTQSTDVESVSGATLTSEAIKTAVAEAIKDAK
ncbi:flavocytochrome c [Clostridium sp. NSJ-6]|uniref:Urocanate reductase n=1 Tax=Clostridium hominis TaxID=2763036 RepID=A0ABR7DAE3_9CLOT|nr:flavocytochrome c [Clostridium hominis]MBC5628297.1 flavocytochrome c [Clostridium hominis]MDU2671473.1 flavocytochrome c [Clostridium sp.]